MSEMNKYAKGEKICDELFKKTGDIRYHNMKNGFKELQKENAQEQENGMGM